MLRDYAPLSDKKIQEEVVKLRKDGKRINDIANILKKETTLIHYILKYHQI